MDTYCDLAETEIDFIRQQAGWLSAFASGLQDHAPEAAARLHKQAQCYCDEVEAASRRAMKLLDAEHEQSTP